MNHGTVLFQILPSDGVAANMQFIFNWLHSLGRDIY